MGDLKAEITRGREGRGCKRNTGWKNQSRLSTTIFLVCFERCTNQWIVRSWCRWGFQMSFCGRIWVSRFYGMLSIWGGLGSATSILLNNLHHKTRSTLPPLSSRNSLLVLAVNLLPASSSQVREVRVRPFFCVMLIVLLFHHFNMLGVLMRTCARSIEARPSCFTRVVAQVTHVAVERASISPKREGSRLSEIPCEATVPLFEPSPRRRRLA
ncbi:hypothetical protein DEO72_LG5g1692 [Vigna unguiculata]|uniref:Uncharacterized protein n=1 Tax=Vigna unguiculata TaxID=3917 RepID=A0A4D6LX50_VIGUN|nr:hypothetical protein DEO72_LG5g1684 [Vigna unguiculata]QCD93617.1 hypothetical protein DEO72_LG5g1692 [Vigna unguiculata]